jgi:hypothetical protein
MYSYVYMCTICYVFAAHKVVLRVNGKAMSITNNRRNILKDMYTSMFYKYSSITLNFSSLSLLLQIDKLVFCQSYDTSMFVLHMTDSCIFVNIFLQ